jgi:uncharacterized repeat protein (TIGR03803 family)
LFSFDGTNGSNPVGGVLVDAAGNLLGTTASGGAQGGGALFQIAKTAGGYASTPTVLVSFGYNDCTRTPAGPLVEDAAGNLFGTTASLGGSVFELEKTDTGYASTLTVLDCGSPFGAQIESYNLAKDADGNLFYAERSFVPEGPTILVGVAEIAKTDTGYAAPSGVAEFQDDNNGTAGIPGSLMADTSGNLILTTTGGGIFGGSGDGEILEIKKTPTGFSFIPTLLVRFNGLNGQGPTAALIADHAGNLFGTTSAGGANNDGTIFKIAKTATGYAHVPTTLVNFDGTNGANPALSNSLISDQAGNLFGTTAGSLDNVIGLGGTGGVANSNGTVFEVTGTGFVAQ